MERRSLARLASLGISVLLCAVGAVWPMETEELQVMTQPQTFSVQSGAPQIKIYVSGAVARPGIYELEAGVRAEEAIRAAGGMTQRANLEKVNLAKKLKDGMQVNVPSLSARALKERRERSAAETERGAAKPFPAEASAARTADRKPEKNPDGEKTENTAAAKGGRDAAAGKKAVDLNSASAEELESLPGVGSATAQAIIKYRKRHAFKSVDDLLKLRGIGPRKLEKLRSLVKV